jgi:hypothetical protein
MIGQSPGDVVREVLALLEHQRWSDVVAFLDPTSVRLAWEERLASARQPPTSQKPMTAEQYREHDPTMPLEVAQWQVDRINSYSSEPRFNDIAGIETLEQLEQLTPQELAARMLEAGDSRYHLKAARAEHGVEIDANDHFERREVIGEVVDAETAYVLYRTRYPGGLHEESKVTELRRTAAGWKLLPKGELFNSSHWFVSFSEAPPDQTPRLTSVSRSSG